MDSSYLVVCLLNAFLSYTTTMLNIVTIHAIRKTPSLSKNLKTLLLSLAVSDLGVGLVVQPSYVVRLIMESRLNTETSKTYNAIYIAYLIPTNLFASATLICFETLVEEVHETDSTEFIKDQTLATSDRNLTSSSRNSKRTKNGFLISRSLPFKCIFILHYHHAKYCYNPRYKKNSVLVKEFKNIAP